MPINTIEGKWTGSFKYDQGYPLDIQARHVFFLIELWDKNGTINGICTDDHTKHLNIGPATIMGTFEKNTIVFTKTYPYLFTLNENREMVILPGRAPVGVEYSGRLRKRLFSSEYYFKGKSKVSVTYTNKMGLQKNHDFWTTWSMKKIM